MATAETAGSSSQAKAPEAVDTLELAEVMSPRTLFMAELVIGCFGQISAQGQHGMRRGVRILSTQREGVKERSTLRQQHRSSGADSIGDQSSLSPLGLNVSSPGR